MNPRQGLAGFMMLAFVFMCHGKSSSFASPLNPRNTPGDGGKKYAICSATSLNIRSEASTQGTIVAKASKGDWVEIIGESGEWIQVKTTDGKTGWSMKKFFHIGEEKTEPAEQPKEKPKQEIKKTPETERPQKKTKPDLRPQTQKPPLSLGVIGGVALSKFSGKDASKDFSNRFGFLGGAVVFFPLSKTIGIQPEVLYVMKGAVKKKSGVESTVHLDYVDVPVLCRAALSSGINSSVYLLIGPYLSYNIQAIVTRKESGSPVQEITDVKKMDYGLSFGGGFQSGSLFIEARYGLGLSSIHDEKTDPLDLKNACITLALGWMLK